MPYPVTTYDARLIVSSALNAWADQVEQKDDLDNDDPVVARDVALARVMAANVKGWTHTTRLREFLESGQVLEETGTHGPASEPTEAVTR